jgi:hypothetical protein
MKKLLQDLRTGNVDLADVPRPLVRAGHLLIATDRTLVSAGTERMLVEFGCKENGGGAAVSRRYLADCSRTAIIGVNRSIEVL